MFRQRALMALCAAGAFALTSNASGGPAHGLWVWKTASVLAAPGAAGGLRDYCQAQGINEVYVSFSPPSDLAQASQIESLIGLLHRSSIRIEALLSSEDADEPGKHRDALLEHVRGVVEFNRHHTGKFDGIHLDIEPQQRPENKGADNLRFLPGLVDAYHSVRAQADPSGLTVNADIQSKVLKGNAAQRRMLLSSLPRLTLMLYELNNPGDGKRTEEKTAKLVSASRELLGMAFADLPDRNLATISIALRTPDYGALLPAMLHMLDATFGADPHYGGWARHSYNDVVQVNR